MNERVSRSRTDAPGSRRRTSTGTAACRHQRQRQRQRQRRRPGVVSARSLVVLVLYLAGVAVCLVPETTRQRLTLGSSSFCCCCCSALVSLSEHPLHRGIGFRKRNMQQRCFRRRFRSDALGAKRSANELDNDDDRDQKSPEASKGTFRRRELLQRTSLGALAAACSSASSQWLVPPARGYGNDVGFSGTGSFSSLSSSSSSWRTLLGASSLYRIRTTTTTTTTDTTAAVAVAVASPSFPMLPRLLPAPRSIEDRRAQPSVQRVPPTELLRDLASHRAVVLGEHHPSADDHLLQAALVEGLHEHHRRRNPDHRLAVGLEAFQRPFQRVLDAYCAGAIGADDLRVATEWDSRWYWSFDSYLPLLETCRSLGIPLLALDASTEDRNQFVERGGWEGLLALQQQQQQERDPKKEKKTTERVPDAPILDAEGAIRFGSTEAYNAYARYTLRPIYELQARIRASSSSSSRESGPAFAFASASAAAPASFSEFAAKQAFRDEAMASAAANWLASGRDGGRETNRTLVACVGTNHATFRCGVPGRLERVLSEGKDRLAMADGNRDSDGESGNDRRGERRTVCSVLLNPEPLNTGTPLEACNPDGTLAPDDDDDDNNDDNDDDGNSYAARFRRPSVFVRNRSNQVCIARGGESAGELQNYALQFEYENESESENESKYENENEFEYESSQAVASAAQSIDGERSAASTLVVDRTNERPDASRNRGPTVLPLSEYLVVSPAAARKDAR